MKPCLSVRAGIKKELLQILMLLQQLRFCFVGCDSSVFPGNPAVQASGF